MNVAPLAEVKAKLSAYVDEAEAKGPVVITRNGKAVAVLIAPASQDDLEQLLLSRSRALAKILERSRQSLREGKGIPAKEFWKQVKSRNTQTGKNKPAG
ncbi:MAG: type II toxin-antitoxin system Phd/YefM family antitoxin [Pirellulaceae bacterium]|nr:type II toxin-antitoxin system Phd/YefM family antitoxin [Pirellulaceae bacterium]